MINYDKCFERHTPGAETRTVSKEQTPWVKLVKECLPEEKQAYQEKREKYSEMRKSLCERPGARENQVKSVWQERNIRRQVVQIKVRNIGRGQVLASFVGHSKDTFLYTKNNGKLLGILAIKRHGL